MARIWRKTAQNGAITAGKGAKMDIFDNLNEAQIEAVKHIDGAMLILAGAGTGKTKTITSRLAYLISRVGIDPLSTLTLTFTNKAANEMRSRALALIERAGVRGAMPLLCTFHKFGLLFLKMHIERLGRRNNFAIIDTDDRKRIIKELITQKDAPPSATILAEISRFKNLLLSPDAIDLSNITGFVGAGSARISKKNEFEMIVRLYALYEDYLAAKNLVDFDDLLLLPYRILQGDEALRTAVSQRYRYIMVDEYQDTNKLQLELLKLLCATHQNLVVVGDDDQSIYEWRGAKIENILTFDEQFKGAKIVRLEQNYRSTPNILKAANELIAHNRNRLGKTLMTTLAEGVTIRVISNANEIFEANLIASEIDKLIKGGERAQNIAVLYRVNALSRSLEEALAREGVAYKMVGGVKFFERSEVKDAVAYLRLIFNQNDDFALTRIINRPKRGIGEESLKKLTRLAFERKVSLFDALNVAAREELFSKKICGELAAFCENLLWFSGKSDGEIIEHFDEKIGLKAHYERLPDYESRIANLDEFYGLLAERAANEDGFDLQNYLNELSLQNDQDNVGGEAVCLMSIHASKGLEFKHVFVIGLEEKFFPLDGDDNRIEEERRLAYVAFTRARETLTLSSSNYRIYKGQKTWLEKSRFLSEAGLVEGSLKVESNDEFRRGNIVQHDIFGLGYVLEATKIRGGFKLKIKFGDDEFGEIVREIMSGFVTKID